MKCIQNSFQLVSVWYDRWSFHTLEWQLKLGAVLTGIYVCICKFSVARRSTLNSVDSTVMKLTCIIGQLKFCNHLRLSKDLTVIRTTVEFWKVNLAAILPVIVWILSCTWLYDMLWNVVIILWTLCIFWGVSGSWICSYLLVLSYYEFII